MPRKIHARMSLDAIETEALYTRAVLQADEYAALLLPLTDGWLTQIDALRQEERKVRTKDVEVTALRIHSNARLDDVCTKFSKELLFRLNGDKSSPVWTRFFSVPVSTFIRKALREQIADVKGWLSIAGNEALDNHKAALEKWATQAQKALDQEPEVATLRAQKNLNKIQLVDGMTRTRDGLHDALSAIAREQNFPRDWADAFFFPSPSRNVGATSEDADEGEVVPQG